MRAFSPHRGLLTDGTSGQRVILHDFTRHTSPPATFRTSGQNLPQKRAPPPFNLLHHRLLIVYYGTPAHLFCRVMIRAEAASRRQKKQSYVEPQTQYSEKQPSSPQEEGTWFEIKEIVAEGRTSYRIAWAGEDPATGQPWKREWVRVTHQLTTPSD